MVVGLGYLVNCPFVSANLFASGHCTVFFCCCPFAIDNNENGLVGSTGSKYA